MDKSKLTTINLSLKQKEKEKLFRRQLKKAMERLLHF